MSISASANLSPLKMTAIDNLRLGNNAKIALQVAGNPWNADGYDGNMFAQNLTVSGWDNSVDQPAPNSIFFDYLGGRPWGGPRRPVRPGRISRDGSGRH